MAATALPKFHTSFGPSGPSPSVDFEGALRSVAVDQLHGVVYVSIASGPGQDEGTLWKFDTQGEPLNFEGTAAYISGNEISGLTLKSGNGINQVAVDSERERVYVVNGSGSSIRSFEGDGEPHEFAAGPGAGTVAIPANDASGVAVDSNGYIYVSETAKDQVTIYEASGEPVTTFADEDPMNLAVDASGVVYVNRSEESGGGIHRFTPSEFPVTGATAYAESGAPFYGQIATTLSVDPRSGDPLLNDPSSDDVYIAQAPFNFQEPLIAWFKGDGTLVGEFGKPGEAGEVNVVEGLATYPSEGLIFAGNNAEGFHRVEIFGPEEIEEGPPTVEGVAVSDVTGDSATLHAHINPASFDTTYRFEYGTSDCSAAECTSVPLGGRELGNGHISVPVLQHLSGLEADTTYHFRVVAENAEGNNLDDETDHTFTTQTRGLGFQLIDARAWELVSPADKHGARFVGSARGLIQAAEDGSGIVYPSVNSIEVGPEGSRSYEASAVLSRRGSGGWESQDITPPHTRAVPIANGDLGEFKLFDRDLATAVFQQRDDAQLSPDASERTPYLRRNSEPPTFRPLVTGKEGVANVPPGTKFGGDLEHAFGPVAINGATPDLSLVVLRSNEVPLSSGAAVGALYAWTDGQLLPVSELPVSEGSGVVEGILGSGAISIRHAISDAGKRIFWSTEGTEGLDALYAHDLDGGDSGRLDIPTTGSGVGSPHPVFQAASADGTVVLFTDTQQLTVNASPSGPDLYRCVLPAAGPLAGCQELQDLSAPREGSGESASVRGIAPAAAEDAEVVYFVADAVLTETANDRGDEPAAGEPNLYLWKQGQGLGFIATLGEGDDSDWGAANRQEYRIPAASSPDGRHFAFMSERPLTGYDNRDLATGSPAEEVFLYDSDTDRLECISCNPSGAAPEAERMEGLQQLSDQHGLWEGRVLAASLPEATLRAVASSSLYRPRSVRNNGRVFFNSVDSLAPADSNGQWDVYQYEPTGTGGCNASAGDAATVLTAGGCVSLLSSGTAEEEAAFLDASASGDDVFFYTPARLSVTDVDGELDVYDARVGGTPAVLEPIEPCAGEACQPAAEPPNDPTPASEAFSGHGNRKPLKQCGKGKRRAGKGAKAHCARTHHRRHRRHRRRAQNARSDSRGNQR